MNLCKTAEDEKDSSRIPTKANIKAAMCWLVQGCKGGDSLLFYYTGHASKVRDTDGDERDGHDEALCPVDYETEGRILDDEINTTIVRPLPHGVTLHAIIDTCFSGTLLDLPYICRVNRGGYYLWENQYRRHHSTKGTQGGLAICISACDEHQTSGDTTTFTGSPAGALTYSFVQLLEEEENLTYGQLLDAIRNKVHEAQKAANRGYPLAYHLWQEPQLSASESFDIHLKEFIIL
ncbi:hypothetical protein Leryth_023412 [Lithospermum erythrorhizon]|nr:hypothetical protein Leryth_023412 [Lithospermum erythrorhizon]